MWLLTQSFSLRLSASVLLSFSNCPLQVWRAYNSANRTEVERNEGFVIFFFWTPFPVPVLAVYFHSCGSVSGLTPAFTGSAGDSRQKWRESFWGAAWRQQHAAQSRGAAKAFKDTVPQCSRKFWEQILKTLDPSLNHGRRTALLQIKFFICTTDINVKVSCFYRAGLFVFLPCYG